MTTFVAVHGAGTGGWLWDDLATLLRAAGHEVHAATLVGVGERVTEGDPSTNVSTHVDQITTLLESRDLIDVVLIGFSYGGYVITGVADAVPERVARLAYLDAFIPQPGRCFFDILPQPVRQTMESAAVQYGEGWQIPPAPVEMVGGIAELEDGVDPDHVAAVLARRGPHPIGTYRETMPEPFRRSAHIPRSFISCTDKPEGDPLLALATGLRATGWTVQEIPTGHFAMLSMPNALAELLGNPRQLV